MTLCSVLLAQSVIIRPLYGTKFVKTIPQNISGNFDATFKGNTLLSHYDKGINIEFMHKKFSIELGYGDREHTFSLSTELPDQTLANFSYSSTSTRELHFMYNRLLPTLFPKWRQKVTLSPVISLGGNLGFNNSQARYTADSSFSNGRSYSLVFPTYLDIEMRDSAANKILYSLQFKAGFNLKYKNVERFRLQFYYTLGLNNIASRTYKYYHTNDFYSGKIFTKGNEYGIVASIPLYIKRKR